MTMIAADYYTVQTSQAMTSQKKMIAELLTKRKLPEQGWDELIIDTFTNELALLDMNNHPSQIGVGEREGRVICPLVARRHSHLAHGIGRSGDINEKQPKADGSSIMAKVSNALVLDAIRISGIKACRSAFIIPCATGLSLTLCLLYLKRKRPQAHYVIWSRIDQKSCFKSITTAGLTPLVAELILDDTGCLSTDLYAIEQLIEEHGPDNIVAVMTTTSCFAPRMPDRLNEVGEVCKRMDIPHLVNNAYGLQSGKCTHLIESTYRSGGRLDIFVQSTDKNFLVPVGGAVIATFDEKVADDIAKTYPGRASGVVSLDVMQTLLHLGAHGYTKLIKERQKLYEDARERLAGFAAKFGESVVGNKISLACTLRHLDSKGIEVTQLGSMLFHRQCSGVRVVSQFGATKIIEDHEFMCWSSHTNAPLCSHINMAVAIGMRSEEVVIFITRLEKAFIELNKKYLKENDLKDD